MVRLRHFAGIVLAVATACATFLSVALITLHLTILDPDWIPDRIERGGVYEFLMTDLLTSAIDEARAIEPNAGAANAEVSLADSLPATSDIVENAYLGFPPERLASMARPSFLQAMRFFTGRGDSFAVSINSFEVVHGAAHAAQALLRDSAAVDPLIEREIDRRVRNETIRALESNPNASLWTSRLFGSNEETADAGVRLSRRLVVLPRVRDQIAVGLDEVAPYLLGSAETFEIRLRLFESAEALADHVKTFLAEEDVYARLYERSANPSIRAAVSDAAATDQDVYNWPRHLFGSSEAAADSLSRALADAAGPDWAQSQAELIIDDASRFLFGQTDEFRVRASIDSANWQSAIERLKSDIRDAGAYDVLYDEVVAPALREEMPEPFLLPYGIEIGHEDVVETLRQAAPEEWVQRQAQRAIDAIASYVSGQSERFTVSVSLQENKRLAERALWDVARDDLTELVSALPHCQNAAQSARAAAAPPGWLPECLPPSVTAEAVIREAEPLAFKAVGAQLLTWVPDEVEFTETTFLGGVEQGGGAEALAYLDVVRQLLSEGWTISLADSERKPHADAPELARDALAHGYSITPETLIEALGGDEVLGDFRARLAEEFSFAYQYGTPSNEVSFARDLDAIHDVASFIRAMQWVVYALTILLLFAYAAAVRGGVRARLMKTSGVLLVPSLAAFAVAWALSGPAGDAASYGVRAGFGSYPVLGWDFDATSRLIVDKVEALALDATRDIAGAAMRASAALILASGAAALAAALAPLIAYAARRLRQAATRFDRPWAPR